jgi:hypothetical protein
MTIEESKYRAALVGLHDKVLELVAAARLLEAASKAHDPAGTAPDSPDVVAIVTACEAQLRSACDFSPGVRQLLQVASSGGPR